MAQTFGPYRLIRRIAAGGMGEVWLAVLERPGGFSKTLALKTILPGLAKRPDFAERFQSEAAASALLNHPNIVQVFDHGQIDGRSYLAMEYVEGPDLASLLAAAGPLAVEPAMASELGVQLCRGLAHAHERRDLECRPVGIVHGDVSPSNVLLSFDGATKLVDFGLARLRNGAAADGAITGKICYMSPEQASGRPLDPRSDLYCLGLVLYELFCGRRAYPLLDPPARTLEAIRQGQIAPLAQATERCLPAGLDEILARALASDLAQRYADASGLARDLAQACAPCGPEALGAWVRALQPELPLSGPSLSEPTEVAARPVGPASRVANGHQRRTWRWLAGLALVFWAVGFSWWWLHAPAADRPAPPLDDRPRPPAELTAAWIADPPDPAPPAEPVRAPERSWPRRTPEKALAPKPAQADPAHPAQKAAPAPRLELSFGTDLVATLDHHEVPGGLIQIRDDRAHLIGLTPSAGGPPEILVRFVPPNRTQPRWRLHVQSTPWMRIWLAGRPAGQTPRNGLVLPHGDSTLELRRGQQILRFGLRAPDPTRTP